MIEMKGLPMSVTIRLFNPMGNELVFKTSILQGNDIIERIPMQKFPAGVYYLQLVTEEAAYYKSIIKTR